VKKNSPTMDWKKWPELAREKEKKKTPELYRKK